MANKKSAGILLYKNDDGVLKYFLVHPGGPYFANQRYGVWSIPKGEFTDEDALTAAIREFKEETSFNDYDFNQPYIELTKIRQKSGKTVFAFAFEGEADASLVVSNHFEMEFPGSSGNIQSFPEIDEAGWFTRDEAQSLIIKAQFKLILELETIMKNTIINTRSLV